MIKCLLSEDCGLLSGNRGDAVVIVPLPVLTVGLLSVSTRCIFDGYRGRWPDAAPRAPRQVRVNNSAHKTGEIGRASR